LNVIVGCVTISSYSLRRWHNRHKRSGGHIWMCLVQCIFCSLRSSWMKERLFYISFKESPYSSGLLLVKVFSFLLCFAFTSYIASLQFPVGLLSKSQRKVLRVYGDCEVRAVLFFSGSWLVCLSLCVYVWCYCVMYVHILTEWVHLHLHTLSASKLWKKFWSQKGDSSSSTCWM